MQKAIKMIGFMMKRYQYGIICGAIALAAFFALSALSGCSTVGVPKPASECDTMEPGESVLCDGAKKLDVNLEITGEVFAAINAEMVVDKVYTLESARKAVADIRTWGPLATGKIDVATLGAHFSRYVNKHPLLRIGTRSILLEMTFSGKGVHFTAWDVDKWDRWCDTMDAQLDAIAKTL